MDSDDKLVRQTVDRLTKEVSKQKDKEKKMWGKAFKAQRNCDVIFSFDLIILIVITVKYINNVQTLSVCNGQSINPYSNINRAIV